jgi:hypothetical protein
MEENISREAGATAGQYTSPEDFQSLILETGRIPAERNTTLHAHQAQDAAGRVHDRRIAGAGICMSGRLASHRYSRRHRPRRIGSRSALGPRGRNCHHRIARRPARARCRRRDHRKPEATLAFPAWKIAPPAPPPICSCSPSLSKVRPRCSSNSSLRSARQHPHRRHRRPCRRRWRTRLSHSRRLARLRRAASGGTRPKRSSRSRRFSQSVG